MEQWVNWAKWEEKGGKTAGSCRRVHVAQQGSPALAGKTPSYWVSAFGQRLVIYLV